jgi:hypothetical protein
MYRDLEDSRQQDHSPAERQQAERQSFQPNDRHPEMPDQRNVYPLGSKSYRLNDLEARLLIDVGKFHTIEKGDLLRKVYKANQESFDRDLTHLHRQNLIRIVGPKGSLTKYIVLTNPAKQLAEKHLRTNDRQEIYAGAIKIREMKHDAALYRLYQKAAQDIEKRGGRVARVVLDYEFKREINKRRRKMKDLPQNQQQQRLREIAEQQQLKVVNGKIPLPDLRIEYEDAQGSLSHCDLEYVTEDYRAAGMAEKRAAGFQFYTDDPHGRKPYGPDLIGGLISL